MAWAPDGKLLVSRPRTGDVVALTPGSGQPAQATLVAGLTQPHGLAFAGAGGSTLYVAESNGVDTLDLEIRDRAGASLMDSSSVTRMPWSRFCRRRWRAWSTRIRRIVRAATAKNCARFCQLTLR